MIFFSKPSRLRASPFFSGQTLLLLTLVGTPLASAEFYSSDSKHDTEAKPVAISGYALGLESSAYHTEWDRRRKLGQSPAMISTVAVDGVTRYTAVFHRNPNFTSVASHRDMSESTYQSRWEEKKREGYRVIDVTARFTSSGAKVFDAVWAKDERSVAWESWTDLSESQMLTKIISLKTTGYRPLRINMGLNSRDEIRYSAAFVKDGLDVRVALGKTEDEYRSAWDGASAAGYAPADLSTLYTSGSPRFTGLWVKDPAVSTYESRRNLTLSEIREKLTSLPNQNAVLIDLEQYRIDTSGELRYAAIWHARAQNRFSASNTVSDLRKRRMENLITASGAKVGFFVEDLVTGNWIAYNANEPFYLASTSKVFIGAETMRRVADGSLSLSRNYTVPADYIREIISGDQPGTAGSYSLSSLLGWMLNNSSTNATDAIEELLNASNTNQLLIDGRLHGVGEITPICELDKRIYEIKDSCVRAIPCGIFEPWTREGSGAATRAQQTCMNNARPGDAEYLQYYGTLANSATPAEYGRFWRKILKGDLFPIAQRDQFLQILSGNAGSSYTGSINSSTNYTRIGTKNGSKYRVHSWVAVAWDQSRASGISEATDRARYSLSFFTEEWPLPSGSNTTTVTSLAQPLIASLAGEAINHLKAAAR